MLLHSVCKEYTESLGKLALLRVPPIIQINAGHQLSGSRWGNKFWKTAPKTEIHLYGTAADRLSTSQIAEALPAKRIQDHAGQTDLVTFARELATCAFLVGNDTGGVHLANALGTPVHVLYGPTNPLVTGPFFEAERNIIQPTDCPKSEDNQSNSWKFKG